MQSIWALLNSIYFEEPSRLQFLSVVPILFILWFTAWVLRLYFRPVKTHGSRYPFMGSLRIWLAIILMLPFMIGAWAKPFTTQANTLVKKGNAEVIFIVDYSSSMFLKDTGLARIDIARREILKLLALDILKDGDKASLFLLQAVGLPPRLYLTSDLNTFANEVSRLGLPQTLRTSSNYWGSNVVGMFQKLYLSIDRQDIFNESGSLGELPQGWQPKFRKNRLIVIFTDGDFFNDQAESLVQDNKRMLYSGLQELRKRGLKIYPVGVGTRNESRLIDILKDYEKDKDYDPKLEEELSDKTSRLNSDNLELLKNLTGGVGPFIIQNTGGDASEFIRSAINSHRSTTIELDVNQEKKDLWLFFLLTALTIFVAGLGRYYVLVLLSVTVVWKLLT